MKSVLYPICNEILNRCEFGSSGKVPDKTFIEAIRYLQQNFTSEGLTLTSTATALGIHSVYLSRLFAKNSGMSFTKYVNLMRCTHAAERIRNERDLSLSQIAYESGFGSIRSFNREFINHFVVTPKEYRNNLKKQDFDIETKLKP
jgi:AraC-like DNA-binding protein